MMIRAVSTPCSARNRVPALCRSGVDANAKCRPSCTPPLLRTRRRLLDSGSWGRVRDSVSWFFLVATVSSAFSGSPAAWLETMPVLPRERRGRLPAHRGATMVPGSSGLVAREERYVPSRGAPSCACGECRSSTALRLLWESWGVVDGCRKCAWRRPRQDEHLTKAESRSWPKLAASERVLPPRRSRPERE